jgi:hypothetical protein
MTPRDRVLIVEDDWVVARDFSRMLNRGGFDVADVASSAEEALLFFDDVHPDMVLLDVGLKGRMDGIELAAAISATKTPVALAFVTGMTDVRTIERVKALGPFTFIVKPVSEQQLSCAVELALHRSRIEQRLVAERNLSESDFRQLFDAAPDAMVVVDSSGRILLANAELERRFGYRASAIVGEAVEILVPAALRDGHMKQREWFGEQPHVRRMGELMQLSARRADGSEVPVEVSLTPIGTGPGMRIIAVIRDASDRQLFQQVSDERRLLAEQVERVVRLEAVGRLAGGVAHDFNNMLTVVSGYTDALLHDDLDAGTERLMLEGIRTATSRAAGLTRQLLAFGRRQALQPKVVDLAAVLTSMRGMLARLVGESIQLVITSAPDVKAVTVDPTQMEQVIMNLVMNARIAMDDGGTLTIETNNVNLVEALPLPWSAGVAPAGVYVMLSVRDEGIGMAPETVARAFEPFFTTRDPGRGTGLGLSTVYGIVKQSGGYVWIDSKPGIGTAVYLLLPPSDEAVAAGTPVEHTALPHGFGTVLLVEDEPEVRELLVQTLSQAGYTVVAAANGRAALEAFEAPGPRIDIIVTDVVMPETSGPALARAARAQRPDLKVLFISGYADEGATGEMVQDASTRYLQKPFNRNQLLRGIAELLGGPPVR